VGTINLNNFSFDYQQYTWANRPTKALTGSFICITDIGPSDEIFRWNGTRWAPMNGSILLAQTGVRVDLTGTTTTTTLASVTVPGGLMSANGILEVHSFWSYPNNANNKTIYVKYSGTGGTSFLGRTETTTVINQSITLIRNTNSTSAQIGSNGGLAGGVGVGTGATITNTVNTASDSTISIMGALGVSTDTISLYGYRIIYRE